MEKDKFGYWIYKTEDHEDSLDNNIYIKSRGFGALNETDANIVGEKISPLVKKILESKVTNNGLTTSHYLINPEKRKSFYVSLSVMNEHIRVSLPPRNFNKKGQYQKPIKTGNPEEILDFKEFI